ncbi:NYN domain-containing protein [Thermogemmatispora sp.]|uniref:NYN domain-containing protein n=1 Tax=Thermogemmatispora sp. TaxID=1968838 RepID=UPI001D2511D2|nr:NYN domain-containing protein [Thermogemmatispora sp.]MBX5451246.1 NYN domain-containing protein [Thermogemmatispora sp.]
MGQCILVDGYNVIRRNPQFRAALSRSLESAREQLITQLVHRYRHTPYHVTVVFDGTGKYEQHLYERRIHIIYSRHGEKADQVIARLAREARASGHEVQLFSDDSEVRQSVTRQGGLATSTQGLAATLNAPPRQLAQRFAHQIRMRALYGLDPAFKLEDYEDAPALSKQHLSQHRRRRGAQKKRKRY